MNDELIRARARAAWARTILLCFASIACMIMCAAYAQGLPRASSAAVEMLDVLGGPFGIRAWATLFGAAGVAGVVVAIAGWRANWLVLTMGALFGCWGFVFLGAWVVGAQPNAVLGAVWLLLNDVLLSSLLLLPARRS